MKIILTESQYRQLTEENLKDFLFKFWDNQKEDGEQPSLDDIIYQLVGHSRHSAYDNTYIRPIWYEYNGGYQKVLQQVKDEILHGEFQIIDSSYNLDIIVFVRDIHTYGDDFNFGGEVNLDCVVVGGTVDGFIYDGDEQIQVPNMDIFEQWGELEYDTHDFEQFLEDETDMYFDKLLEKYGVPIHTDLMIR
jgi:hypothetical protein